MEILVAAAVAAAVVLGIGVTLLVRRARRNDLLKKAQTRLDWGDLKGAARLFFDAGDRVRAASLFAEGGERVRAVEIHLSLKAFDAALEALRGGKPEEVEKGAALLAASPALKERQRAAALAGVARSAGLHRLAARLFESAGNADDARASRLQEARSLASQGKPIEAATIYKQLGETRAAAAAQAEAARRETDPGKKRELALEAAKLLREVNDLPGAAEALAIGGDLEGGVALLMSAGNLAGAAQLLQWTGHHGRAADLFEKAGDFRGAAKAFGLGGDRRKAAAMLEKGGDPGGAARLLLELGDAAGAASIHLRGGRPAAAAEILAGSDDIDAAVKVYVGANLIDEAVALLCKRGRAREAAALLESRGDHHRAAVVLAEAGDLTQRARLLVAKGDYEGAARTLLEIGQFGEARAALARATMLTAQGRFLLARACMASSDYEEAAKQFGSLLDGSSAGVPRVDALYGLARAFEAMRRLREAITTLEELLTVDANYRDAALLLKLLRARLEPALPPTMTPVPGTIPSSGPIPLTAAVAQPGDHLPPEWGGGGGVPQDTNHTTGVPSRYVVEKEIGRGAMGVVYRALDSQLGRTVAIKVLERQAGADPRIREYFLREARAVAQLVHPNIVTLFDAGLEGSAPYLVMELVDGEDLRTRLQQGPLPVGEALRLIAGVASALDLAHSRRIVHRDVKPENILVGSDGSAKLMDFGVAHVVRDADHRHATVIGTPVYMAPEQIKGEGIGGWTDTYALGAVLYECLVGVPPFDPKGALYHHVNTPAPDPRSSVPDLPPVLAEAILSCLAKDPKDRPATARVFGETLQAIAATLKAA